VDLESAAWRAGFCRSARKLLDDYPGLAGVHVNIEPCPSGNAGFLRLLEELRAALPKGKILSVAAYPPPTVWHRFPEVHWEEPYFREVAARADQLAVMMYDTSLRKQKPYRHLMAGWTREVLAWSGGTKVLLGLPAYDDAGSGYHHPDVENLRNALLGVHGGLGASAAADLPANYQGVALYSEWEMDEAEWAWYRGHFLRR
jgi:spore germination protein YaaH